MISYHTSKNLILKLYDGFFNALTIHLTLLVYGE